MRDDLDFHISLLREVEANPFLYDPNDTNYNNRTVAENAWAQIGKKLDETAIACNQKWRNLRSTYIRYIHTKAGNRSGTCPQKEYYLAPYFNFLIPFTKSRKADNKTITDSSLETKDNDSIELKVEYNSIDYETEESRSSDVNSFGNPTSDLDSQPAINVRNGEMKRSCEDEVEVPSVKRKRIEVDSRDACELFLLSLVPRMQTMTERQQLSFQIGVMQLMQSIKYSTINPDV